MFIPFCRIGLVIYRFIQIAPIDRNTELMPTRLVGIELREADKSGSFSLRDRIDIDARVFVLLKTDGTQQRSVWEQDFKIGLMLLRDSFLDRRREHETLLALLPRLVKPRTCSFKLGLERRKDLCDLIRYFAQNGQQYGIDGNSVGLIGFSGGATLAAAAAIRSAAGEIPALKGVVLHYPYLDSVHMPSEKEHFDCDMDPAVMSAFTKLYSKEEERSIPLVSPVCASAEELNNFAPTMVIPAEKDALRKEGLLFADKLREAGAAVYCKVMPDVHHGYIEDAGNMEFFNTKTFF